jgi:hypothetical protein
LTLNDMLMACGGDSTFLPVAANQGLANLSGFWV